MKKTVANSKRSSAKSILRGSRGQIVVEYVLLLVIGVGLAALITSKMVSRDAKHPGFLVKKWSDIIQAIGSDPADDLNPPAP